VILADSTIWIDLFRGRNLEMQRLLEDEKIVMHPFVAAELALGSLKDRRKTLAYLDRLPQVQVADLGEVRSMIEAHALYSKGIGLVDAHLIASCLLTPGTQLWTRDTRLAGVVESLGVIAKLPFFN
jgi:predicted nucleic acid-binding protein